MKYNLHRSWVSWGLLLACIGLCLLPYDLFGQSKKHVRGEMRSTPICTLTIDRRPIWGEEYNFTTFINSDLKPGGPKGLKGEIDRGERSVSLRLSYDDNFVRYLGSDVEFAPDGRLREVGKNMVGIDVLLDAVAAKLIADATSLDMDSFRVMEGQKFLEGPLTLGVSVKLMQLGEFGLETVSGIMYKGELQFYHPTSDTLKINLQWDGVDTVASVVVGEKLTEFSLAALKAFVVQERLKAALLWTFGPAPADLDAIPLSKRGIYPIVWRPLAVYTNHPNQEAFTVTTIGLDFGSIRALGLGKSGN